MKVGIFGGGFKPFTAGHFTELSLAVSENDIVILFYALAKRKKGGEFEYTAEMAKQIFEIMRSKNGPLMRAFGKNLIILEAIPNPLSPTFDAIAEFTGSGQGKFFNFEKIGIQPSNIDVLTVYGDRTDADRFLNYLNKPEKKSSYYGDFEIDPAGGGFAALSGKDPITGSKKILRFDTGFGEMGEVDERSLSTLSKFMKGSSEKDIRSAASTRGTQARIAAQSKNIESLKRHLPPNLTDQELSKIAQIMGVTIVEGSLRNLIRQIIISG